MRIITDLEIQTLPLIELPTKVTVCNDINDLEHHLKEFELVKAIGIDTEKRPSFKKGTIHPLALVQISTHQHTLLIQIQQTGYHPKLWEILENPSILKIGVALRDDFKDLGNIHPIEPKGVINLDALAKAQGLPKSGLRFLAAQFLNARISKKLQTSNWAVTKLNPAQVKYAAIDAWVCLEIYPFLATQDKK